MLDEDGRSVKDEGTYVNDPERTSNGDLLRH